jgi:FHS family L-fucose permease-like MFS transporter
VLIGRSFILSGVEHSKESLAALTPQQLAQFYETEAHAVQMPYLALGGLVLLWAILVALVKFPDVREREAAGETNFAGLFRYPHYLFGIVAQFFYVGAQVGVWSYLIRYAQHAVPGMGEKLAAEHLTYSLVAFIIGRFLGTALMTRFRPDRLMAVFAACNVALSLVAVFVDSEVGLYALVVTSFFMSIMFPTIFALSLKGLGARTKAGSSLLVMAIIGGAVLTALMGRISDLSSINYAMLIPALGFVVVGAFALSGRNASPAVQPSLAGESSH